MGELGDVYQSISQVLLLSAILGASWRFLPENSAEMKRIDLENARAANVARGVKGRQELPLVVKGIRESLGRKSAHSRQCAKAVQDELRARGEKPPGSAKIRAALKEAC
jgi:hypothetical protein